MRKIKYLLLAIILFIPVSVRAATGSLQITCTPTTVNPGSNISCAIKGTSDENIGSLKMNVELPNSLSLVGFTKNAAWEGSISDGRISLYNEVAVTGTFDIGTLNLKANDDASVGQATVTLSTVMFYYNDDIDSIEVSGKDATITISEASTATGLSSLKPSVGEMGQFIPDKKGYTLVIPAENSTFGFTATAANSSDTITFVNADTHETITDPTNITFATSGGSAEMSIKIEVGTGTNQVIYTVLVLKDTGTDEKGYELASLKVGDKTIELVSETYNYEVVLADVSSYQVVATIKDSDKFEILTNLSNPKTGEGSFTIITAPKDSSSGLEGKTYTINVSKGTAPASTAPSSSSTPINPPTGGALSIFVALVLMASFGASIYFYKRNMVYFSK